MTTPHRGTLFFAGTLFTISGALGLGYQLVWIRKATLIVGASQIALSTVLTGFFLGLALGSLVVGRYLRSRRFSPLFIYGLFEAGIGLYALAFPVLFGWVEASYGMLYDVAAHSGEALFLLRFVLLFLLFLMPTFFMGGTLPLLLDGLVERDASIGSLTSLLYGLNIIGAVLGVLITGYFAIPQLGMNGTSLAAGVGNLSIAVVAIFAFRRRAPFHLPKKTDTRPPGPGVFFSFLAVLSGLATIGYQIAWARYFSLFKTASVHLTSILLAVFLAALAAGSMIMARLLATGVRPLRVVGLLQPLAALIVLYGLGWWRFADYTITASQFDIEPSWYFWSETVDSIFFAPLFQIGLVIFLPVMLLGTALPGIIAAATRHSAALRGTSGRLVFWNTIGASAGGFASGYLLIPAFGLTGTMFVLALLTLILGAAAEGRLAFDGGGSRRFAISRGHILTGVGFVAALLFLRGDVTRNTVRHQGVGKRLDKATLVDLVEGPLTTGSIFSDAKNLYIASDDQILAVVRHGDLSVQAIEGHLPALFYPKPGTPKRVLGIAVGSGQSFGAMLRYPIEQMDVVDISTEMIELAFEHFREFNCDLGNDPRVAVHLDDGRHFIQRVAPESYDVISMEPPPPTAPGVHALYSLEFYQAAERVLREDGVLMQWLPLYWITPNEARGIVKTQAAVFPYTFIVRMGQIDFVTLSFKRDEPPRFRVEWIEERAKIFAQEHEVRNRRWTSKCRHGTASLEGILALFTTGPEDVARMNAPYIYRDDDQRLSYSSGDRHLLRCYHGRTLATITFCCLPRTPFADLQRYFVETIPVAELDEERARALALYRVHSPSALAEAEMRFKMSRDPSARMRWALDAAKQCAHEFEASKHWLECALAAGCASCPDWIAGWTRYHLHLHARDLRRWIEQLDPPARNSTVARLIETELKRYQDNENERLSSYLAYRLTH
jgi:spermidine synthase